MRCVGYGAAVISCNHRVEGFFGMHSSSASPSPPRGKAARLRLSLASDLRQWLFTPWREMLAGAVATFALIPEVIGFSFAAGVAPTVGLFAASILSVVIAFAGGRPAMVTAAAGSVALVVAPLVAEHGLPYLFAAGLLAGCLQILFGALRCNVFMRFVSQPIKTGFVNALAILIFCAQLPHLRHADGVTWLLLALGLVLIYGLPRIPLRLFQSIPSPLICIVVITCCANYGHLSVVRIANLGQLPDHLPLWLGLPSIPFNWESGRIIVLPAVAIAVVGLLESIMTAEVVDTLTQTTSSKRRESIGLGLANIASGLFGGIAGCGMIGQSVSNVRYGGRGRLSTLFAGVFLLILIVLLRRWILQVPVIALVAVMVMVSVATFDWGSLRALVHYPRSASAVMLATVLATLWTHDLAVGVGIGIVLNGLLFAAAFERAYSVHSVEDAGVFSIRVRGHVFYLNADALARQLTEATPPIDARIVIDLSEARIWDVTAALALKTAVARLGAGRSVRPVCNLRRSCRPLVRRIAPELLLREEVDTQFSGEA